MSARPAPLRSGDRGTALPVQRLVPPPSVARRVATVLSGVAAVLGALALVAPWQQSVRGAGRVVAYAPLERQQTVEAPIDGRVTHWFVREGARVAEGEVLLDITDNDGELTERLDRERELTVDRVASYEARVEVLAARLESVRRAQESAIVAAEARVRVAGDRLGVAEQAVAAAEAELETQRVNLVRSRVLVEQGLLSQRDVELAALADARNRAAVDGARSAREAARGELESARASVQQARAARDAEVESAMAARASAETDRDGARAAVLRLDTRMARQSTQRVLAPRAGTVFRLLANQGGEQVRAGDPLVSLVPDTEDRAVEVWIDGNDASLVSEGRRVRLQFEGWPAVQFTGWPSVAVGTFGGEVALVDATDDGRGNFRIVVTPDAGQDPWPGTRYLRQGVRVNAWVLLNEVRLGFELWRQLNGFPPTVSPLPSTSPRRPGSGSGGGSYGGGGYGGGAYGGGGEAGDGSDAYGAGGS